MAFQLPHQSPAQRVHTLAHFIYVAEGFMEDCDMLIRSLTEKYEKVDWPKFCKQWKELQFDILFYGRLSGAELVELTEECLQCARLYMITETDNYEEQVVGTFIAYAISIMQPYSNLCFLRLTPEDVAPLKKFEDKARKDNRTDVLMILGRLYIYHTHYHVSTRERAMDFGIRKYYDETIRVPKTILREWHGKLNRNNIKNWEKIGEAEKKYMETKKRFSHIANVTYPGSKILLDTSKPIAEEITDSLRKLILAPKKENEKAEETNVNSLKMKALKNEVNPMRHLTGLDARKAGVASPIDKSPTNVKRKTTPKSVRSKIKENSHNVIVGNLKQYTNTKKAQQNIEVPAMNSLPSLDEDIQEHNSAVALGVTAKHPFRGFTAEEIEKSNATLSSSDIENSPNKKTNNNQSPKTTSKASNDDLEGLNRKKRKNSKKQPQSTSKSSSEPAAKKPKIMNNNKIEAKTREAPSLKAKVKNKKTITSKLSEESVIDTNDILSVDDDCGPKENIATCKTTKKEIITEESKGKDLVEYKINDIIIHADQDLPELEIELIDEYTEAADKVETEQPIETTVKTDINDEENVLENINGERDTIDSSEETVEVVRILTESEAAVIETKESLVVPRRNRKRSSLQSKLRRMGILPVANFYNDDASDI